MSNTAPKLVETECNKHEQIEVPVEHFFAPGVYGRMMIAKAGTVLVGKTHKHAHLAMLLEGEVSIVSKYGTATYKAPYIINVNAGDKRAFAALTDVKWITIHATEETDLQKLEQQLVEA